MFVSKPIVFLFMREAIIDSTPSNAPPQTNKIFFVLTFIKLCSGCFLPPRGGTLAVRLRLKHPE